MLPDGSGENKNGIKQRKLLAFSGFIPYFTRNRLPAFTPCYGKPSWFANLIFLIILDRASVRNPLADHGSVQPQQIAAKETCQIRR